MMSIGEAKRFAEKHYPAGPEKLAEKLDISIQRGELKGCDGWVLMGPAGTVIRLNSAASANRQRFTLAHELGHLLLEIPTIVGESVYDSLKSDNSEERKVNDLASELLLPKKIVQEHLSSVPVVAAQLRKVAKDAKVSELAAAIRVANLAAELGLVNASVAFFQNDEFEWNWSKTLRMPPDLAAALLADAQSSHPTPLRVPRKKTNDVIVASLIDNPHFGSATLFVQLLPADLGNQLSAVERRLELEKYLFQGDDQFRMQLQGVLGAFHPRCKDYKLEVAIRTFYEEKAIRWEGARLLRIKSAKGREYVRLRLQEWCKD